MDPVKFDKQPVKIFFNQMLNVLSRLQSTLTRSIPVSFFYDFKKE